MRVYIYVHSYIHIYISVRACVCIYVHICIYIVCAYICNIYMYIHVHIYIYIHICIYVYIYVYIYIYVYMYICIYIYTYTYIYIYMYICIHIYIYSREKCFYTHSRFVDRNKTIFRTYSYKVKKSASEMGFHYQNNCGNVRICGRCTYEICACICIYSRKNCCSKGYLPMRATASKDNPTVQVLKWKHICVCIVERRASQMHS